MRAVLSMAVAAALCAACGGDDDGAIGGDGGQVEDGRAAEPDAPVDAAGPRRVADSIVFVQRIISTQIRFSDDPEGPGSCLSEPVAGCEIQTCSTELVPLPRPDAGQVTVTPAGGAAESYLPDAMGEYPSGPAATWEDGDAVAIEAEGDAVPAFRVDLTGPGDVTSVVAPAFPTPLIRRDQALLVEWTGAESFVAVAIRCPGEESVQVRCPLPDGTTGQVPVAALQRLPACGGATFSVFTEHRELVEPGGEFAIRVATRGEILSTTATVE